MSSILDSKYGRGVTSHTGWSHRCYSYHHTGCLNKKNKCKCPCHITIRGKCIAGDEK